MIKNIFIYFSLFSLISCSTIQKTNNEENEQNNKNELTTIKEIPKPNLQHEEIPINNEPLKEKTNENIFVDPNNTVHIFEAIPKYPIISQLNLSKTKNFNNLSYFEQAHPLFVTISFLDSNLNNKLDDNERIFNKDDLILYNQRDIYANYNATGIINMSYGFTNSNIYLANKVNDKSEYIDSLDKITSSHDVYHEYFSRLLFDKNYTQNRQLRIKSLGNMSDKDDYTNWVTAHSINLYQFMSPELQKIARNDIIYVKNIIRPETFKNLPNSNLPKVRNLLTYKDENYYELQVHENYGDSKAMLLRSFVVAQDGFIKHIKDNGVDMGSSYAAPRVTRLAYELKKKFPFLRYNQIKQIILTTTKASNKYLDPYIGWGVVDNQKALNGIGALNAGLIEEEEFYSDMPDKIKDKKGNIYFYLNIPNSTYEWSNDIYGGLEGDGNNNSSIEVPIYSQGKRLKYRMPLVLDSEKKYYNNIAQAGLRKDGAGTIILSGKQHYHTNTQILNGTLELKNDSNSKYEIFDKGIFKANNSTIKNDVINEGTTIFENAVTLNNYYAQKNSKTIFSKNAKLQGNEIIIKDKFRVEISDNNLKDFEIIAKKTEINDNDFENIFLKLKEEKSSNENKKYTLTDNSKKYFISLENLSEEQLRNIPIYNQNTRDFYKEYKTSNKPLFSLGNIVAKSQAEAISSIFTDNYTSFISENIDIFNQISKNYLNEISHKPFNSFYINSYNSFNLKDNKKFTKFSRNINGLSLGLNKQIKNDFSLAFALGIYNSHYNFFNDSLTNTINNTSFNFNLTPIFRKNNFEFLTNFGINIGDNSVTRTLNKNEIKINSNFKTREFIINSQAKYNINIFNGLSLSPKLGLNYSNINIFDIKEKIKEKNFKQFALSLTNNILNLYQINLGLEANVKFKNLNIINSLDYSFYPKDTIELNAKLNGVNFKLKGQNLKKHSLDYNLMLKYTLNKNFSISNNFKFNTNKKFGLSSSLIYIF